MFITHQRANESTKGIHRCSVSHTGEISQTHHPLRFSIYIGEISHERKRTTLKVRNPHFPKISEVPKAMQTCKDISSLTTSHSLKLFTLLPSYQFQCPQASSQNHSMLQTTEHHGLSSACAAELNSSVSREWADFFNPYLILKIPSLWAMKENHTCATLAWLMESYSTSPQKASLAITELPCQRDVADAKFSYTRGWIQKISPSIRSKWLQLNPHQEGTDTDGL